MKQAITATIIGVTAIVALACVKFDYQPDVPQVDRTQIENGIAWSQKYLDANLGGRATRLLTVQVRSDADGCGQTVAHAGNGYLCIATGHEVWGQFPDQHEKITSHEYFHHWQEEHRCISSAPVWLMEGMAEYVGYQVIIENGLTSASAVHDYHVGGVTSLEMPPLEDTEQTNAYDVAGIYSLYYLAVEQLTQEVGVSAYRTFCDLVAEGVPWQEAFQHAFHLSPETFYEDFRNRADLSKAPR